MSPTIMQSMIKAASKSRTLIFSFFSASSLANRFRIDTMHDSTRNLAELPAHTGCKERMASVFGAPHDYA